MGRVILLGAHVQSRDTEQEGSAGREGEIELVHLQLVPVDCGKDYTHRERERDGERQRGREMHRLCLSTH